MQIKIIPSIIVLAISSLIAYAFYNFASAENQLSLLAFGGGISLLISLWGIMGFSLENPRATTNIKVLSTLFFIILLVSNIIFCCIEFYTASYIIINGIILLIGFLCAYGIVKSKQ